MVFGELVVMWNSSLLGDDSVSMRHLDLLFRGEIHLSYSRRLGCNFSSPCEPLISGFPLLVSLSSPKHSRGLSLKPHAPSFQVLSGESINWRYWSSRFLTSTRRHSLLYPILAPWCLCPFLILVLWRLYLFAIHAIDLAAY